MKIIWLIPILIILPFLTDAQSNLKQTILNKEKSISTDWVNNIQQDEEWEYIKTVTVSGNKVKDYYLEASGENWMFKNNSVEILPYNWKINNKTYSDFSITYYKENRILVISSTVPSGKRSIVQKEIYKVINLTNEYLILEKIKDHYCFDFANGRTLTKKECKEKVQNEPKRMFGGPSITIGKKPPKFRLVLKKKE